MNDLVPPCIHGWFAGPAACLQCLDEALHNAQREVASLQAQLAEAKVEQGQQASILSGVLRMHTSYSLPDVLGHLVRAVDHLLHDHSCDGHGYEVVGSAQSAAKEIIDFITSWTPSTTDPWHPAIHSGIDWCHTPSCDDPLHRVATGDDWKKQLVPGETFTYAQARRASMADSGWARTAVSSFTASQPEAEETCACLSKNLSVTWHSRSDAIAFGLRPRAHEQGPWCFRCGRPRKRA
jgi:hypothetical protein